MNYRGKVIDENGQPLVGAHIVTVMAPKRGTITDFDGVFEIGDARYGEAWEVAHLGYRSQVVVMDRNVTSGTFVLQEDALALDEFVGFPTTPYTPPFVPSNEPYIPGLPSTVPNYSSSFQNTLKNLPPGNSGKKGFWDSVKSNPFAAFAFGLVAVFAGGYLMKEVAKKSDNVEHHKPVAKRKPAKA